MRPSTAGSRSERRARRGAVLAGLALLGAGAGACAGWQQPGESLGGPRPGPHARYIRAISGRTMYVELRGGDANADPAAPANALPPVLLVHGFASNHEVWATLEPALRARRRTINVDLPGFGWSERTEGDYSPEALARDLWSVLDALSVPTVDVVAHSWGSSVSLAFTLARPAHVRRVVLIGAWVYDEQIPPFFRAARVPGIGEALFTAFYRERPEDRFPLAFEDDSVVSQDLVDAIERSLERPGTARAALAAARGQCFRQLEWRYRSVRQPTLLVWGARDNVALPRYGERLMRELPDARLELVPRTGHFPMLEAAGVTRRLVTEFLDAPERDGGASGGAAQQAGAAGANGGADGAGGAGGAGGATTAGDAGVVQGAGDGGGS